MDSNGGVVTAVIAMAQIDTNKAFSFTAECVSGFTLLTHLLEDVSAAADLTQQLAVGDGQVMAGRVPFPEKEDGQEKGNQKSVSAKAFSLIPLTFRTLSVSELFVSNS